MTQLDPIGSQLYRRGGAGTIGTPGATIAADFDLDADQRVSVAVTGKNGLAPTVEVREPGGAVVATRFGILATSLVPRLPRGTLRRALASLNAFDPNVAIAVQQPDERSVEREFWRVTAAMMGGWFPGIVVGTFIGNVVGEIDRLGLDAVFPAALLSIIAGLLRTGEGMAAGVAGAVICLALIPIAPAGVPIILSVFGAVVGAVYARRSMGAAA